MDEYVKSNNFLDNEGFSRRCESLVLRPLACSY